MSMALKSGEDLAIGQDLPFDQEEKEKITAAYDSSVMQDPLLILKFNLAWEVLPGNNMLKSQVISWMAMKGGKDNNGSGFNFHFEHYMHLLACRDEMKIALPGAFHHSPSAVQAMNVFIEEINVKIAAQENKIPLVPPSIPMAEAWVIMKETEVMIDYYCDRHFFLV